jgi:hypothetical protein
VPYVVYDKGGEEPSHTTRRRRTARAASGSHVGGGKERESTSSCETLHKLWTRLLNNAWGSLVSARPTMHKNYAYKLRKMRSFQTETAESETAALTNYESRRNAHDTFLGCRVNGLTQASA